MVMVLCGGTAAIVLALRQDSDDIPGFEPNHAAIRISSDSDFTLENGVVGGSGTPQDPYIISGWDIVPAPLTGKPWNWDSAVDIRDTEAFFTVQEVRIKSSGEGDGILMVNAHNGMIKNCTVKVAGVAVHLLMCSMLNISGCDLGASDWPALWSYGSANISIRDSSLNSTFQGNGDRMTMYWPDSTMPTIRNCTIGGEVRLYNCSNGLVTDNCFEGARGGLVLEGTSNTSISRNVFEHRGISFSGGSIETEADSYQDATTNTISSDNMIGERRIECHAGESGVTVDGVDIGQIIIMNCTDVAVANSAFTNSDSGILMVSCETIRISRCTATECRMGIRLLLCSDIQLSDCDVTDNTAAGIAMVMCTNGNIFKNDIERTREFPQTYISVEDAGWGLLLYNSGGIVVDHNNFVDNQIQAGDITVGEKNDWDAGYPWGGNFWSDYEGTDEFSGPGQNLSGDDGIGDSKYQVAHENSDFWAYAVDNYPLMSRFD